MGTWLLCISCVLVLMSVRISDGQPVENTDPWVDDVLCVQAADSLGILLAKAEEVVVLPEDTPAFREIIHRLTNYDLMDPISREQFLCPLSGLWTLSQLEVALADIGLEYQVVRIANSIVSNVLRIVFAAVDDGVSFPSEVLSFYGHLHQYGLTSLDTVGQEQLRFVVIMFLSGVPDTYPNSTLPELDPSSLNVLQQCDQLLEDIEILQENYSYQMNNVFSLIGQGTGLNLYEADVLSHVVCEITFSMNHTDLYGLYRTLRNHDVFNNLVDMGYPEVVSILNAAFPPTSKRMVARHARAYRSRSKSPPSGKDAEELLEYAYNFVSDLRAMGLLNLVDDIDLA